MPNIINGFDFDTIPAVVTYCGRVDSVEWPHFLYNVVFQYANEKGVWTVPYKCGLGHTMLKNKAFKTSGYPVKSIGHANWLKNNMIPKPPTKADIIYSLLMDSSAVDESFTDWCANYGYSDDSINALNTYKTCCEIAKNMRKTFTREQLETMRTALGDY